MSDHKDHDPDVIPDDPDALAAEGGADDPDACAHEADDQGDQDGEGVSGDG